PYKHCLQNRTGGPTRINQNRRLIRSFLPKRLFA
uniref:Uncharacterized protein n=1 Tax=Aegilops tauschii subsp. strangulata TaxID=200361 RepID=A0A452YFT5_AEGTS